MLDKNTNQLISSDLYDKAEAAQYLRTTERHVQQLAERRVLGHCRVGRFLMFSRDDLDAYVASTHVAPEVGA